MADEHSAGEETVDEFEDALQSAAEDDKSPGKSALKKSNEQKWQEVQAQNKAVLDGALDKALQAARNKSGKSSDGGVDSTHSSQTVT